MCSRVHYPNIEIYVNDMMVKSKVDSEHLGDLQVIFEIVRSYKLRSNASISSFGVVSGKFLVYIVTHKGVDVNPD